MPTRFPAGNEPVRVFISSDETDATDTNLVHKLISELNGEREDVRFSVISLEVQPGDLLKQRTQELLERAQIVLFLVTSKFLETDRFNEQAFIAMKRSREGKAAVIPVLFTAPGHTTGVFADVVPFRPGIPDNRQEQPSAIAQEIGSALVKLVQSRREGKGSGPESDAAVREAKLQAKTPWVRPGLHFRATWIQAAALLMLAAVAALFWLSANPAGHHIKYKSPSPLTFFLNSCVIGFAAMSILQISRRLLRMRGAFHEEVTADWLGEAATAELYRVVPQQRIKDMFDLPSELLTGQLGAIADQVMEKQGKSEPASPLILRMAAEDKAFDPPATTLDQDPRVRSAMAIQRNLDQFQISSSAAWRRYLLETSIVLSMALFIVGLWLLGMGSFIPELADIGRDAASAARLSTAQHLGNFCLLAVATGLTALFSGFLASIARDLVAIVEKLRR